MGSFPLLIMPVSIEKGGITFYYRNYIRLRGLHVIGVGKPIYKCQKLTNGETNNKMKFLPPGFNTKAIEKEAKNKWRWEWLTESDSKGEKWSTWLKKPDVMGIAFCEVCAKSINYKSNGKKGLRLHAEDEGHRKNLRTVKTNQEYVKKFQTEAPQIHILHEQMVDITKAFMAMFIKPEHIPKDSVAALVKLDVSDRAIQKSDKDIAVGKYALPLITKARQDKSQHYWLDTLLKNLRTGYLSAATKILQLPLRNKTIRCLSVLDPYMHSHSQIQKAFNYLASLLPNVISEEETGCLDMELNAFCVDQQVTDLGDKYDGKRIDVGFWSHVRKLKTFDNPRYPVLSKLVCALLTAFSGPLIEGTFNVMGDIIEEDRSTMTIENYEAIALIKTALKRKKVKSHQLKVTPSLKRCVMNAYGNYKKHLSTKKEKAEKRKKERLDQSIQKLKIEKAKRLTKLIKLKNRITNKKTTGQKRKNLSTGSTSDRQWKRIKTLQ